MRTPEGKYHDLERSLIELLGEEVIDEVLRHVRCLVCETKNKEAANINNGGIYAQLEYLKEVHGAEFVNNYLSMLQKRMVENLGQWVCPEPDNTDDPEEDH